MSQKINSDALRKLRVETRGYISWFSVSDKLLRNYSKTLSLKSHTSILFEVDDASGDNPFNLDSDHESLKALVSILDENKFEFIFKDDFSEDNDNMNQNER